MAYIYPNIGSRHYDDCARRFTIQYAKYDPGQRDHSIYVIVNGGGTLSTAQRRLFDPLPVNFMHHDNSGKDIGAYQMIARRVPCDLLVCLGSPVRPRMDGWLGIIEKAVLNNGPGLYGAWGFHAPVPHIRTTAFFIPPEILNEYPYQITDRLRYFFEHDPRESITMFCKHHGFPVCMVTAKGVFPMERWHHVQKEHCTVLDQHVERIGYHDDGGGW